MSISASIKRVLRTILSAVDRLYESLFSNVGGNVPSVLTIFVRDAMLVDFRDVGVTSGMLSCNTNEAKLGKGSTSHFAR